MKGRSVLKGVVFAFTGAVLALFLYTTFLERGGNEVAPIQQNTGVSYTPGLFTSFNSDEDDKGPVDFTFAAERTVHAVVHVKTKSTVATGHANPLYEFFYGPQQRQERQVRGAGSGVIVSPDGYIITNNHVIDRADEVEVTLNDNRVFTAEVIGRDPSTDIALIKIDEDNLPWIRYGDSDELKLGEWVLAVGNPFNLTSTVTAGIVSAKGRSLGILDDQYRIESFIQTDAALNMGNSGGALVNTRAELVGITTAILSPSGAFAGNSFAVPVTIVRKVAEDLREFGAVQRAIMGVSIRDVDAEIAAERDLPAPRGVYIQDVTSGGGAEEAGIRQHDVIVRINQRNIASTGALQEEIGRYRPGDKVDVTVIRDGRELVYSVTLRNLQGGTGIVKPGEDVTGQVLGAVVRPLTSQEMRRLRVDSGVRITEISDGILKERGIKVDDIIISVNETEVSSADDIINATQGGRSLTAIEGLQANGTYFSFRFRGRE